MEFFAECDEPEGPNVLFDPLECGQLVQHSIVACNPNNQQILGPSYRIYWNGRHCVLPGAVASSVDRKPNMPNLNEKCTTVGLISKKIWKTIMVLPLACLK